MSECLRNWSEKTRESWLKKKNVKRSMFDTPMTSFANLLYS